MSTCAQGFPHTLGFLPLKCGNVAVGEFIVSFLTTKEHSLAFTSAHTDTHRESPKEKETNRQTDTQDSITRMINVRPTTPHLFNYVTPLGKNVHWVFMMIA